MAYRFVIIVHVIRAVFNFILFQYIERKKKLNNNRKKYIFYFFRILLFKNDE